MAGLQSAVGLQSAGLHFLSRAAVVAAGFRKFTCCTVPPAWQDFSGMAVLPVEGAGAAVRATVFASAVEVWLTAADFLAAQAAWHCGLGWQDWACRLVKAAAVKNRTERKNNFFMVKQLI